jgi:hypothetical protein
VFSSSFGTSAAADAFNAAMRIPNILQNLFGEGVLSASFIPVYAGLLARDERETADRVAAAVGGLLALAMAVLVAVGLVATPLLVSAVAVGFTGETRALTVQLVRIVFPGIGLLVMGAWCLGVLNSHRRFLLSYLAPVAMNVVLIATLLYFGRRAADARLATYLAWGAVAGALAQVLVQLPTVLRVAPGLLRRDPRAPRDAVRGHVRLVARNFAPVLVGRGVVQISGYIDNALASLVAAGAVTVFTNAQTLYQLPGSLFGMSIAAAELPAMSSLAGDDAEVAALLRARLSSALRRVAFFVIPSAAAFLALGDVLAAAAFGYGRFTPADVRWVWGTLAAAPSACSPRRSAGSTPPRSTRARRRARRSASHWCASHSRWRRATWAPGTHRGGSASTRSGAPSALRPRPASRGGSSSRSSAGRSTGRSGRPASRPAPSRDCGAPQPPPRPWAGRSSSPWDAGLRSRRPPWSAPRSARPTSPSPPPSARVRARRSSPESGGASRAADRPRRAPGAGVLPLHEVARRGPPARPPRPRQSVAPMITAPEAVAAKLPHLPDSPGVYLWKDADGKVLYVGKAKRLRSRVRSYFASDHPASPKTRGLVRNVQDLETIVVPTEAHALILEANLIKEYRPRFNIALKDDKNYPYIKVTVQEPYPRVFVTRRLQSDGARYFGPYTDVGRMRQALNVVKRIFTVRSCNYDMPREMPERACLDFAIKRCKAPCIGNQSLEDYRAMVDEVTVFLDGKTDEVVRRISARMEEASERLDFERAGELRDALRHLQRMQEPTVVLELEGGDRDVVGYARDGDDACVAVMRIRGGKLLARDHRFLENIDEGDDDPIVLAAFLARSYLGGGRGARRRAARAVRLRRPAGARGVARPDAGAGAAARLAPPARRPRRAERAAPPRGVPPGGHGGGGARRRPGVRAPARTRAEEGAALAGLLRHLARAGHRYGRVVRVVRERPRQARRIPQVQGRDGAGDRRLRVDARGRRPVLPPPARRGAAAPGPRRHRRRQGPAQRRARGARGARPR